MEHGRLRNKLEDIVALKQEYGIGSQDAFAYLRSQDNYGKLRDSILENLRKEGLRVSMSVRELSKLCEVTREVIGEELSYAGVNIELETGKCCKFLGINAPFPQKPRFKVAIKKMRILSDKTKEIKEEYIPQSAFESFHFDYESFFTRYFIEKSNSGSDEWFDVSIAEDVLSSGNKFFIDDEMKGKRYNWFDITNDDFLISKNQRDFSIEDKEYLTKHLLGHSKRIIKIIDKVRSSKCTEEERKYLFHVSKNQLLSNSKRQLYNRANREGVLGRLEVERKIALFHVTDTTLDSESPSDRIDYVVNELRRMINTETSPTTQIEVYSSYDESRDEALASARKFTEKTIAKTQYILRALIKNRRWLVNYLSR